MDAFLSLRTVTLFPTSSLALRGSGYVPLDGLHTSLVSRLQLGNPRALAARRNSRELRLVCFQFVDHQRETFDGERVVRHGEFCFAIRDLTNLGPGAPPLDDEMEDDEDEEETQPQVKNNTSLTPEDRKEESANPFGSDFVPFQVSVGFCGRLDGSVVRNSHCSRTIIPKKTYPTIHHLYGHVVP